MIANCSAGFRLCSVTGALNHVGCDRLRTGAFPRVANSRCSVVLRRYTPNPRRNLIHVSGDLTVNPHASATSYPSRSVALVTQSHRCASSSAIWSIGIALIWSRVSRS